ncbi:hypothetical protein V2J09_013654 [Rumex salicifolius]
MVRGDGAKCLIVYHLLYFLEYLLLSAVIIMSDEPLGPTGSSPSKSLALTGMRNHSIGLEWIMDSGVTDHMTNDRSLLDDYQPFNTPKSLLTANGTSTPIFGSGNVVVLPSLPLNDVLFVPTLSFNPISVKRLEQASGTTIKRGKESGSLYILETSPTTSAFLSHTKTAQLCFQHHRLGHPSLSLMKHLSPNLFVGLESESLKGYKCYCPATKQTFVTDVVSFDETNPYYPSPDQNPELTTQKCHDLIPTADIMAPFNLPTPEPSLSEPSSTPSSEEPLEPDVSTTIKHIQPPPSPQLPPTDSSQFNKVYSRKKAPTSSVAPISELTPELVILPTSLDVPIAIRKEEIKRVSIT